MQASKSKISSQTDKANEFLIQRRNSKAAKILSKLLDEEPLNDEAWLLLGIANRRLGLLEEAVNCFKTAVDINREMEEAWGLLTITFLDLDNINMAKKSIEKARELNPDNEKIDFYSKNLIRVYKNFGPFF